MIKFNSSKFVFVIILLCAMFPYIKTSPMGSDTQPHFVVALLIGLLFWVIKKGNVIPFSAILFSCFFSTVAIFLDASWTDIVSIIAMFVFMGLLTTFGYKYIREIDFVLKLSVVVYFAVGLLQVLDVHILDFMVSNVRTTDLRGVTSLASEPSFFGLISLAFIVMLEFASLKYTRLYQLLGLFCVAMSASLTAIIPTLVILIAYFGNKISVRSYVYLMGFSVLFVWGISTFTGRAAMLVNAVISDPESILEDASAVNRMTRSLGVFYIAADDYFIPHSFEGLAENFASSSLANSEILSGVVERLSNVSSIFVYGFGFFSLPLLAFLIMQRKKFIFPVYLVLSILLFLTANISIATPYVPLILIAPYILYLKQESGRRNTSIN